MQVHLYLDYKYTQLGFMRLPHVFWHTAETQARWMVGPLEALS